MDKLFGSDILILLIIGPGFGGIGDRIDSILQPTLSEHGTTVNEMNGFILSRT
jgi:hypothetical protein